MSVGYYTLPLNPRRCPLTTKTDFLYCPLFGESRPGPDAGRNTSSSLIPHQQQHYIVCPHLKNLDKKTCAPSSGSTYIKHFAGTDNGTKITKAILRSQKAADTPDIHIYIR